MNNTSTPDADVVELTTHHNDQLLRFFRTLPQGDLTFIKEDVTVPEVVRSLTSAENDRRWVALRGDIVAGYVAVRRLSGWSNHVGEVRLVVASGHRGTGLGRTLARHALTQAVAAGLTKLVVEVVAEQGAALALFTNLGFSGEALLVDHIRDRQGELRDLMVLAHHVRRTWEEMDSVGVADELASAGD